MTIPSDKLCGGKRCYSKLQVGKVRKAVMKARNRRMRVYECSCGYWHLTHID